MKAIAASIMFLAWTVACMDIGHKAAADYAIPIQAFLVLGWLFWLIVAAICIIRA